MLKSEGEPTPEEEFDEAPEPEEFPETEEQQRAKLREKEAVEFWQRMGKMVSTDYRKDLEKMMCSDSVTAYGTKYEFSPVKSKNIDEFKVLDKASFEMEKDTPEWTKNVKKRACLLIKDMTPEKFDEGDFGIIENVTTAWSNRQLRGFRRPEQSLPGVV